MDIQLDNISPKVQPFLSIEVLYKNKYMWSLWTWFNFGLGRAGLTVGLDDFGGCFHPKWFHDLHGMGKEDRQNTSCTQWTHKVQTKKWKQLHLHSAGTIWVEILLSNSKLLFHKRTCLHLSQSNQECLFQAVHSPWLLLPLHSSGKLSKSGENFCLENSSLKIYHYSEDH